MVRAGYLLHVDMRICSMSILDDQHGSTFSENDLLGQSQSLSSIWLTHSARQLACLALKVKPALATEHTCIRRQALSRVVY